jgi:hypothetical protein
MRREKIGLSSLDTGISGCEKRESAGEFPEKRASGAKARGDSVDSDARDKSPAYRPRTLFRSLNKPRKTRSQDVTRILKQRTHERGGNCTNCALCAEPIQKTGVLTIAAPSAIG